MAFGFVVISPTARLPLSPAERLINQGRIIRYAERDKQGVAKGVAAGLTVQQRALALLVTAAVDKFPALMFQAMFEGWSNCRTRFEIQRLIRSDEE